MKFSRVHLIMMEIPLSRVQKITHAAFGNVKKEKSKSEKEKKNRRLKIR